MIPNDFEARCSMIEYMLQMLEDEDGLTEWEENFVESVSNQFEKNKQFSKTLSDRQCEILERIYDKYN